MTTREVVREFSRRGRLPDLRLDLPPAVGDLDETMRAAVALKPDTILIIAGAGDAAQLVHAVRKTQGNVAVFGGQTMGRTLFAELAGSDADGVRFPLLFAPDRSDSDTARFIKTFTGERGHAPDYTAAFAYDATRLLIEAIHRAGPNRARIREAILELSPWQGIAGGIHFDGTGQNLRSSLCLGTFRDGVVVAIDASAFALCAASVTTP